MLPSLPVDGGDRQWLETAGRAIVLLRDLVDATDAARRRSWMDEQTLRLFRAKLNEARDFSNGTPVSSSAADEAREALERAVQQHIGGCREDLRNGDCCWRPAEYLIWGKLAPREALGPRCYKHAVKHVGDHALRSRSQWALVNVADLAADLAALPSPLQGAGDAGDDLRERMVSVLRDAARTRRSDAWGNVAVAAQELLAEIDEAPAPAVEQKETTR